MFQKLGSWIHGSSLFWRPLTVWVWRSSRCSTWSLIRGFVSLACFALHLWQLMLQPMADLFWTPLETLIGPMFNWGISLLLGILLGGCLVICSLLYGKCHGKQQHRKKNTVCVLFPTDINWNISIRFKNLGYCGSLLYIYQTNLDSDSWPCQGSRWSWWPWKRLEQHGWWSSQVLA